MNKEHVNINILNNNILMKSWHGIVYSTNNDWLIILAKMIFRALYNMVGDFSPKCTL